MLSHGEQFLLNKYSLSQIIYILLYHQTLIIISIAKELIVCKSILQVIKSCFKHSFQTNSEALKGELLQNFLSAQNPKVILI